MKSYKLLFIHLLLGACICGASGCGLAHLASDRNAATTRAENQPAPNAQTVEANGAAGDNAPQDSLIDAGDVEGIFELNNHRANKGGYENKLSINRAAGGKINVYFEGMFFFDANGAETFHDTAAEGDLTLRGNTASGKLTEKGSENGCAIELNFTADRVNLKSTNCDLNVTPDGVYKKSLAADENLDADVVNQNRASNNADGPYIQYDGAGEATALVNLLNREGERADCSEEVSVFTGKVLSVISEGDFDFEFTLANGARKRQKISLLVSPDDKIPYDDLRAIIRQGNNLKVRFIYCGNGGYATPTEIYKK